MAAVQVVGLGTDALAGIRAAHTARQLVGGAQDVLDRRPDADLAQAQRHFAKANERTRSWTLAPMRLVPVVGRQLRAVEAITAGARTITEVGTDGLADVRAVLEAPHRSGPDRVALLRQLADVAERARARLDDVEPGPEGALVPPVAEARQDLVEELADLHESLADAHALGSGLAEFLQGRRRYLVLGANNAEMRAGAGMVLSIGEMETADGRMKLDQMQPVSDVPLPDGAVPRSGDFAARWGWMRPTVDWPNLLASPRFEVSAALAASMWEAAGNRPVDGVLLLDPLALQAILDATGPVEVGGQTVTGANVVDHLLVQQYLGLPPDESLEERRDDLAVVAPAAVAALDRGQWSTARLADSLNRAVRGRHLMLWSRARHQQGAWHATEMDGSLRPESLMVSVLNGGGTPLDPYLRVRADLQLQSHGNRRAGVLRVTLRNEAPEDAPRHVVGPGPGIDTKQGDYVGVLAVHLPGATTAGTIDGGSEVVAVEPDGPSRVLAAPVVVPRGEQRTMEIHFGLPAEQASLRVEPSARVPNVEWSFRGATWADVRAQVVAW